MDRRKDEWMDKQTDEQTVRQVNEQTHRLENTMPKNWAIHYYCIVNSHILY